MSILSDPGAPAKPMTECLARSVANALAGTPTSRPSRLIAGEKTISVATLGRTDLPGS